MAHINALAGRLQRLAGIGGHSYGARIAAGPGTSGRMIGDNGNGTPGRLAAPHARDALLRIDGHDASLTVRHHVHTAILRFDRRLTGDGDVAVVLRQRGYTGAVAGGDGPFAGDDQVTGHPRLGQARVNAPIVRINGGAAGDGRALHTGMRDIDALHLRFQAVSRLCGHAHRIGRATGGETGLCIAGHHGDGGSSRLVAGTTDAGNISNHFNGYDAILAGCLDIYAAVAGFDTGTDIDGDGVVVV